MCLGVCVFEGEGGGQGTKRCQPLLVSGSWTRFSAEPRGDCCAMGQKLGLPQVSGLQQHAAALSGCLETTHLYLNHKDAKKVLQPVVKGGKLLCVSIAWVS